MEEGGPDDCRQSDTRTHWRLYIGLTLVWLGVVGFGLWRMMVYSFTASPPTPAAEHWPSFTRLEHSRTLPTLVLALHPHCSCSRATIEELAIVAAHCKENFSAQVLFYRPIKSMPSWSDTDLKSSALRIPGVHVIDDPGGAEAATFQAATSGELFLYDTLGHLLFHGGITASRGHAGDNYARHTVISLLNHDTTAQLRSTPIFGCSLRSEHPPEVQRKP